MRRESRSALSLSRLLSLSDTHTSCPSSSCRLRLRPTPLSSASSRITGLPFGPEVAGKPNFVAGPAATGAFLAPPARERETEHTRQKERERTSDRLNIYTRVYVYIYIYITYVIHSLYIDALQHTATHCNTPRTCSTTVTRPIQPAPTRRSSCSFPHIIIHVIAFLF